MARATKRVCRECGFYVQLSGSLGTLFGVCCNEMSADGRVVIDRRRVGVFCRKELRLVVGDRPGQIPIGHRGGRETGFVQPNEIVPVAGEPRRAPQLAFETIDVRQSGLFPECPFGAHHARRRTGEV